MHLCRVANATAGEKRIMSTIIRDDACGKRHPEITPLLARISIGEVLHLKGGNFPEAARWGDWEKECGEAGVACN